MHTNSMGHSSSNGNMQGNITTQKKITAKIYSKGTIKLPRVIREQMHLEDGAEVEFIQQGDSWSITTRDKQIEDGLAYIRSLNPGRKLFVDEMIEERRKLAAEDK